MPDIGPLVEWLSSSHCQTFFWGFVGSLGVEIATVVESYKKNKLPARFSKKGFWFARIVLACFAGIIAVANANPNAIVSVGIGAATPLILATMAQKSTIDGGTRGTDQNL